MQYGFKKKSFVYFLVKGILFHKHIKSFQGFIKIFYIDVYLGQNKQSLFMFFRIFVSQRLLKIWYGSSRVILHV